MSLKRRHFLMFLGATAGASALGSLGRSGEGIAMPFQGSPAMASSMPFDPVRSPMPLTTSGLSAAQQVEVYGRYAVQDDLVLPPGYTYDVIGAWEPLQQKMLQGFNLFRQSAHRFDDFPEVGSIFH
ncbi:MAG: hypothetical protein F6K42_31290 [Leptolyngbya sp. SIO1D8]|nr:hypothetical protein [Leptolyngbya sp. SIO1D8]